MWLTRGRAADVERESREWFVVCPNCGLERTYWDLVGIRYKAWSVGPHSFTVRARDRAGNASSVTRNYRVVYDVSGFSAPLTASRRWPRYAPTTQVPAKFSLAGNHGLGVLGGSPTWRPIDCKSGASLGDASAAPSTLSYLAEPDRYLVRVESDRPWRRSCRQLALTLADGDDASRQRALHLERAFAARLAQAWRLPASAGTSRCRRCSDEANNVASERGQERAGACAAAA